MSKGKRALPTGVRCLKVSISITPGHLQLIDGACKHHGIYRSEALRRLIHQGQGAGLAVFRKEPA